MRLWHRDLIPFLPRQQLISQWRELCCIVKSIARTRTPNHLLVNKVLDSRGDFYAYTQLVLGEMKKRGYKISNSSLIKFNYYFNDTKHDFKENSTHFNVYPYWHTDRYLFQCITNLSEKYDCDGISDAEWNVIKEAFPEQVKIIYSGDIEKCQYQKQHLKK